MSIAKHVTPQCECLLLSVFVLHVPTAARPAWLFGLRILWLRGSTRQLRRTCPTATRFDWRLRTAFLRQTARWNVRP